MKFKEIARRGRLWGLASLTLGFAILQPAAAPAADAPAFDQDGFAQKVRPILQQHCVRCHGEKKQESELRLDRLGPDMVGDRTAEIWNELYNRVNAGEMPPKKEPRLSQSELAQLNDWVSGGLKRALDASHSSNGGRIVIRRLNRQEYNNTIRDLVGIPFDAGSQFPSDPTAFGFDNVGNALSVSPLHMEKYLQAARRVVDRAIVSGPPPKRECWRIQGELRNKDDRGYYYENDAKHVNASVPPSSADRGRRIIWSLGAGERLFPKDGFRHLAPVPKTQFRTNTLQGRDFTYPVAGEYIIRVHAYGHYPDGPIPDNYLYGPPRLNVTSNGVRILTSDVTATKDAPKVYEARFDTEAVTTNIYVRNRYDLTVNLILKNLAKKISFRDPQFPAPYLAVEWYEIDGPVYDSWPPESHTRILFPSKNRSNEDVYAREVLEAFASRAFRRPARPEEVDRLVAVFKKARPAKPSFEEAIKVPLIAVLCSPDFLFLTEDQAAESEELRPLNDYELASRLSYFLWSSMPDAELLTLAQQGKLRGDGVLAKQVQRMLKSPKSGAFVDNFAGQWLGLRKLGEVVPDEKLFPQYGEHLEESMAGEAKSFFAEILNHDLPLKTFIDSDFAMLNERLARFYEIKGIHGDEFRKVRLKPEDHRGGLLTQGFMLTITSNGTRTSPVKRGVWVLENILADPPPPPPPNAGEIPPPKTSGSMQTVRQRLAVHRSVPACAACHAKIDPLGFALENYDASGFYRTVEASGSELSPSPKDPKVDARGELPDGRSFTGVEELKGILLKEDDKFVNCLSQKLLVYALGRGLNFSDRKTVLQLRESLKENGDHLRGLITGIVQSKAFQTK